MWMKISKNCINLVKEFEGLQLKAYQDEVGVWTIGWGITNSDRAITGRNIYKGMTISRETAQKWLEESLNRKYLPKVTKYNEKYKWNQNELDALVSFAYNIGSIDGLTAKGTRSRATIAKKLMEYNKAGGRVYRGLSRRRTAERSLFLKPVESKEPEIELETERRIDGVSYFSEIKNKSVDTITEFLHKRGFGAGKPNLSKIAAANAESKEVEEALFELAQKGLLIKPDELNKVKKDLE